MSPADRNYFDEHFDAVMAEMPRQIHELIEEVPLIVDDHPSRRVMREMNIQHRDELCGLHTGIPLTQRSIEQSGVPTNVVHIYREGIFAESADEQGQIDPLELRRQIRITILHELGHHHGLTEEDLDALGYG